MDIKHASIAQVRAGRDGRTVQVTDDLLDVVRRLQEIDPRLSVNWNEYGEYFAVVGTDPDGREWLVTTTDELGAHVVEHVRFLASEKYNAGKAVEDMDNAAKKAADHNFAEKMGDISEHLAHALSKDLQHKHRIFLPAGVRG